MQVFEVKDACSKQNKPFNILLKTYLTYVDIIIMHPSGSTNQA